jgi:putative restriction endonuclease
MPRVRSGELVAAILDAVQQSGWTGVLLSAASRNPRRFLLQPPVGDPIEAWIYIWTLTHGGRANRPEEYRIQRTTVTSPLPLNTQGLTLLLGYYEDLGIIAGFDIVRKRVFTEGSPSVYIDINTVRQALQDGLAFHRDEDGVIAIGVRPDQFMNYALNAEAFHREGADAAALPIFNRAAALEPITDAELQALPAERQRVVQTISRLSRDVSFRQQVLQAYGNRCAVTRMQFRLIDAAHILPVGAPGSADVVTNGICLSPTYHRAFDHGLIYLAEDFTMRINPARVEMLRALSLLQGLDTISAPLGRIHLPADHRQWPAARMIRQANRFRQIDV